MAQSCEFFNFLFQFAEELSRRVDVPAELLVWKYTPLPKSLGIGEPFDETNARWGDFMAQLRASPQRAAFMHQFYAERIGPDPRRGDATFHGHRLFGPFYYEMRVGGVVRPHVAKLQPYAESSFDAGRADESRRELGAMFRWIREREPEAQTVLGNSWMYNLRRYRELYPAEYTACLPESHEDEFQFLALWGQFFDREWRVRRDRASQLLEAVGQLRRIEDLRRCFPLQVLMPSCPIEPFFEFYGAAA